MEGMEYGRDNSMEGNDMMRMDALPIGEQQVLREIFSGSLLPPLYSDIIAKEIFSADAHPDRLNFLMRGIAKDESIDVLSSARNEGIRQSVFSKSLISDLPSWLRDGRLADLEFQKVRQNFLFTRVDLYSSDMLLLQYSVREGQAKSELSYTNVNEVLVIVLMVESPKAFREFDKSCKRYIHRFTKMTADTGLSYPAKAKTIYVQLDKCLAQFKAGKNAETEDGKPDRLQTWLAMIADVNDGQVSDAAQDDDTLRNMRKEAYNMVQSKEVQNMLIQEKYERMDWASYGYEQRAEGKTEEKKETALRLFRLKQEPAFIAQVVDEDLPTVKEWIRLSSLSSV